MRLYASVAASRWLVRAAPAPGVRASGCFVLALGGGASRQPLRASSLPETVVAGDCFGSDSIAAAAAARRPGSWQLFPRPVSRQLGSGRVPSATRDCSVEAYDGSSARRRTKTRVFKMLSSVLQPLVFMQDSRARGSTRISRHQCLRCLLRTALPTHSFAATHKCCIALLAQNYTCATRCADELRRQIAQK